MIGQRKREKYIEKDSKHSKGKEKEKNSNMAIKINH